MSKLDLLGYLESNIDNTADCNLHGCFDGLHVMARVPKVPARECLKCQPESAGSVHKGTAYCLGQVDHGADCYCMLCAHGQKQSCRGADLRKRKKGGGGGGRVAYWA